MGDLVVVDYTLAIDGAETQPDPVEGFRWSWGASHLPEAVQAALVGADAGETRTAVATLADDHPNPDLAGHSVEYTVTVKEIQSLAAAPEGEALAKELGLETLDELRNALRSQHQNELSQLSRARLKRQLLDRLSDIFDFPVPQRLVDMDFDGIWRQIETAKQRQADGEAEPDPDLDKPEEDLRAEYRAIAERRVRLGLLLAHLGRSNGITVPDEAVNSALIREAMQFPGHEREMYEAYRKVPAIVDQLRERLLEDKVVDYIIELAQVTDKTVSEEELRREPEDATSIRGHAHDVSGGEHVHDASCGHHVHGDPPADDASGANDAPEEASR
ncbi:MAG: hypothetical protein H6842_11930 [Rhodospirillaceae bacterium]|nr:hypothetical protein [Rhodospirillaceae bacterium]